MGRKRDTKELEQRRLRAARLLKRRYTQADVARGARGWIRHRALDARAGGRDDRVPVRRAILHHPGLAAPGCDGLAPPAAGAARVRARRSHLVRAFVETTGGAPYVELVF